MYLGSKANREEFDIHSPVQQSGETKEGFQERTAYLALKTQQEQMTAEDIYEELYGNGGDQEE